ncbi:putative P450 monooxygenase [Emericellopsis atlantica]|uniref:P450 monooxygenase n=1 Tax=Emericellopsis atlantica TaxID=2614577 RepID=A0A9P8CSY6_9HYPO|nr:putative P450 monooxygenase [Emericellopsis atlantica]KAG9258283.1 putative P450 monooxygenase [Emericellopsis atlantica]
MEQAQEGSHAGWEPALALAAGVVSHLAYFRRGEHFAHPWRYVLLLAICAPCAAVAVTTRMRLRLVSVPSVSSVYPSVPELALLSGQLAFLYLAGVFGSVIVYRLLLNPLNRFPGPYLARLSKGYLVYLNWRSGLRGHHVLRRLHETYGPYVRLGPNDLSVVDPDGMRVVLGPSSRCRKSAWYGQDAPYISTNTTRDRAAHDRRRRLLTPSFSDAALRGYMVRAQRYNDQLLGQLEASAGQPLDVTKWFGLHGFDVMGDLVFNQPFDMLQRGEAHEAIQVLGAGLYPQGFAFAPWLYRVFATLPGMGAGYRRFVAFTADQLTRRMGEQGKTTYADMMQPLIAHYQALPSPDQHAMLPMLQGDARMLIVAGSDTTSTTLIHLFYRLCAERGLVRRLRRELGPLVGDAHPIEYGHVAGAELLHACVNETLRMHYPAPSGFFRKTPPGGIAIGEVHVPGDTVVQLPPYVMGLDDDIYERSRDFVPERWFSRPEMVKHPDAFMPFLAGSESCIGRRLAYMQLATLTAQIITQFDVALAPGEDGTRLLEGSLDLAMMHPESLHLVFTRRGKDSGDKD